MRCMVSRSAAYDAATFLFCFRMASFVVDVKNSDLIISYKCCHVMCKIDSKD